MALPIIGPISRKRGKYDGVSTPIIIKDVNLLVIDLGNASCLFCDGKPGLSWTKSN